MILKHGGALGVCGLFEKRLKELNPTKRQITYDVQGAGQGDLSLAWTGRSCTRLNFLRVPLQTCSPSSTTCRT